jgi:hypothetical protein
MENTLIPNSVYCEEVIIDTKSVIGKGIEGDPVRLVTRVYTKGGYLIAERDEWKEQKLITPDATKPSSSFIPVKPVEIII